MRSGIGNFKVSRYASYKSSISNSYACFAYYTGQQSELINNNPKKKLCIMPISMYYPFADILYFLSVPS